MEHFNPILQGNDSPQKFFTIGEIMLRLTPPNYDKIRIATSFEAATAEVRQILLLPLQTLVLTLHFSL